MWRVVSLTASSRCCWSGWSLAVCFRISLSSSGYFITRLRGMSRKFHRSSFLLKGDWRQRCRKSCTPPVLLLLVQQGLGLHLVTAVRGIGGETGQLQGHRDRHLVSDEQETRTDANYEDSSTEWRETLTHPVSQDVSHVFCGAVRFSGISEATEQSWGFLIIR